MNNNNNSQENNKKRLYPDYQNQEGEQDELEKQNSILRQLYFERQKRMKLELASEKNNQNQLQNQNIILQQSKDPQQDHQNQNSKTQEQVSLKDQFLENNKFSQNQCQNNSQFYINVLQYYPIEERTHYMLEIQDIFSEQRFEPQAVFMTTYGFELQTVAFIIESGAHFVLAQDKGKEDKSPNIQQEYEGFKNLTLIFPPKDYSNGWGGSFHPKLWLIKFQKFLRVVITSGNLHINDWKAWSQSIWYQDFPKKSSSSEQINTLDQKNQNQLKQQEKNQQIIQQNEKQKSNLSADQNEEEKNQQNQIEIKNDKKQFDLNEDFERTLVDLVQKMMPQKTDYKLLLKIDLSEYQFNNIQVALITSIPGRYNGADLFKYGKCKIKKILNEFPPKQKFQKPLLTYQTTSMGKLDEKIIEEFFSCFFTEQSKKYSFQQIIETRKQKSRNKQHYQGQFQIIFPSQDYILNTAYDGIQGCEPLFFNEQYYYNESFPKDILCQFQGSDNYFYNNGIIPHLKACIITDQNGVITDDTIIYIGSHNATPAAWGKMEKDFTQQYIANTELGFLLFPKEGSQEMKRQIISYLPFKFPPVKYSQTDLPLLKKFN